MDNGLRNSIRKAVRAIRKAQSVLVVSHVNPDGDTVGSQLALGFALLHEGKKVMFACQDPVPQHLQFLPGSELITSAPADKADVAVALDCGSQRRLGSLRETFFKAKTTIQVDHHDFGEPFGQIQVLEEEASAVGEIVYEMIRAMKSQITQQIAHCLLASILIDTNFFRFSNIRPKTFDLCGKLVRKGVDLRYLIEESYWKRSRAMAKLSGHCLAHAEFSADGAIAWSLVDQKTILSFGAKVSDADSVADDLRTIEGVKVAVLFRETDKRAYRVSLRSKYGMNVALIAKRFHGGGHHHSAGCTIRASRKEIEKLLSAVREITGQ